MGQTLGNHPDFLPRFLAPNLQSPAPPSGGAFYLEQNTYRRCFALGDGKELGRVLKSDGVYILACIVAIAIGTLIFFWSSVLIWPPRLGGTD
jgi:hypothetical protein